MGVNIYFDDEKKYEDVDMNDDRHGTGHKIDDDPIRICIQLLRNWGLQSYEKVFVHDCGYDDVRDWYDLTVDDLQDVTFKPGHAKKLIRKLKEYRNCVDLMKKWNLKKYINVFIVYNGFDNMEKWTEANEDILNQMGFNSGESKEFIAKLREYLDNQ